MLERWHRSNRDLPQIDVKDIVEECPLFNRGKKPHPEHQHHPEYTQSSYRRLRDIEDCLPVRDYIAPLSNPSLLPQTIQGVDKSKINFDKVLSQHDRSYGI